eukprot:scaffold476662_cov15-Prasinocladus_malaysianus.AAC.1
MPCTCRVCLWLLQSLNDFPKELLSRIVEEAEQFFCFCQVVNGFTAVLQERQEIIAARGFAEDAMHAIKGLMAYRLDERFNKPDASALSTGAIVAPGVRK